MPVFAAIVPLLCPCALSSRAYSILSAGWAIGRPTCRPAAWATARAWAGAFGGEGTFHLGEQGQQQKCDAARALVGGVDRQRDPLRSWPTRVAPGEAGRRR
jgi:hypothetical protein